MPSSHRIYHRNPVNLPLRPLVGRSISSRWFRLLSGVYTSWRCPVGYGVPSGRCCCLCCGRCSVPPGSCTPMCSHRPAPLPARRVRPAGTRRPGRGADPFLRRQSCHRRARCRPERRGVHRAPWTQRLREVDSAAGAGRAGLQDHGHRARTEATGRRLSGAAADAVEADLAQRAAGAARKARTSRRVARVEGGRARGAVRGLAQDAVRW